jgi:threonine dehydrogenase-like Zn-dependent dehydrogenase
MKAVVFHGVGDIRLDEVAEPVIKDPYDAIVKITTSAICGTDLHMIRGTMGGMKKGTILGHEGVGVVEEVGKKVRNIQPGDRVVIPSTISCGYCVYCRAGYFSQCDNANPNGKLAGTAFYGGPEDTGPFNGMQAEKVRVPFANVCLVKISDEISDDQAIMLSDIFPTAYFGADNAEINDGDVVAVYGCGPVGQFTVASAFLQGAGRVIAIDQVDSRLDMARNQGAEIINFEKEDPVEVILDLTGGIGVDRVIDAVGVDANHPHEGPAYKKAKKKKDDFKLEQEKIITKSKNNGDLWKPGDGPSQALQWCVESVAKAGTISIIGVYPLTMQFFPIGMAMNKNLTIKAGNCNHRNYIPFLLDMIRAGEIFPEKILTNQEDLVSAVDAYKHFDKREDGWVKVALKPSEAA